MFYRLDELQVRIKKAIALCLEEEDEAAAHIRFVGIQRVAV